ncbi:hypothetical protein [Citricoccus sp.]|uniref:hypothetical protein n=1 Tax=Citricoccus sp. TaxID=1978372 RepID=UPI0026315BA0|nr:hypothetical protein [Citricoccus sp.]HRO31753.1 hypothetical protein [Citricoccus sp.]
MLPADESSGTFDSATGEQPIVLLMELRERSETTILPAIHDLGPTKPCGGTLRVNVERIPAASHPPD